MQQTNLKRLVRVAWCHHNGQSLCLADGYLLGIRVRRESRKWDFETFNIYIIIPDCVTLQNLTISKVANSNYFSYGSHWWLQHTV